MKLYYFYNLRNKSATIHNLIYSLPAYYIYVSNRLEKLLRDFLFFFFGGGGVGGVISDNFKFHLVKWLKICTSIISGGLGVKNLIQFNRALLVKLFVALCFREGGSVENGGSVVDNKYDSLKGGCGVLW